MHVCQASSVLQSTCLHELCMLSHFVKKKKEKKWHTQLIHTCCRFVLAYPVFQVKKKKEKKWNFASLQHKITYCLYEPKGLSISINGKKTALTPLQEEMAYLWSKKKDTPYAQDTVFQKNFTKDFSRHLGKAYSGIKYSDIDFSSIYKIVDTEKDARDMMTKEDRKALAKKRKELREKLKEQYGTAILDGEKVEVANYMAELPAGYSARHIHRKRCTPTQRKMEEADNTRGCNFEHGKRCKNSFWQMGKDHAQSRSYMASKLGG